MVLTIHTANVDATIVFEDVGTLIDQNHGFTVWTQVVDYGMPL
jgi:hypothetical protein